MPNEKKRHLVNFHYVSKKLGTNNTSFESPNVELLYQKMNWAWHHFQGDQVPLTEHVLLSLEIIWSLS